jgi:hypothetical protein
MNTFSDPTKSTAVTFIGSRCSRISRRTAMRPSARRRRFSSSRVRSSSVARPAQTGSPSMSSDTHCGAHTHWATSGPESVGTSTLSPMVGEYAPGSR